MDFKSVQLLKNYRRESDQSFKMRLELENMKKYGGVQSV